ncbi:LLM class flavin-dependent oxidoreductase [Paenibacillus chondroitinus]|uniref:LLM class flavin-dependent oxidoreductase n=1 Tax=Paenibacillus chondroitinus TaxID=59842 RepID=A0ABU6DLC8_9BACL|nr:LLM class flavin-dependent oxidoreductase [Paenibacillus chondroitinus]MCY9662422.1 LLM class flavin-dependent oxidoreductase [Paenibacillus anseongense]MEB4798585.1 LLM class flavin-dependent oxidoreductase [Paenibacillus chondroitinus]
MKEPKKQLHLNLFILSTGHHEASWRHPDAQPQLATSLDYYQQLAKTAERGKMDAIFLAEKYRLTPLIKYRVIPQLEAFTLLSAIAAVTEHIGLTATASTTYNEPYHIARKFASLDHISRGRTGWNIVTSTGDATAHNFSKEHHLDHKVRYERGKEFVEVVKRLWAGWSENSLLVDKQSGIYADVSRIKGAEFAGEFFSVKGALNIPRSPQTHPVLVQAGSSEDGKQFAAELAEVIFTAQNTMEEAIAFYTDVKSRLKQFGRSEDQLKILPGFIPFVGDTEAEAKAKERELNELAVSEYGIRSLSDLLKINLFQYPLDGPVPLEDLPNIDEIQGQKARFQLYVDLARRENLTIRELIIRTAGGRGHFTFAGTAVQIADEMERWLVNGAADGFNLMPALLPGGLDDFVNKVIPELQKRGIYRTEYTGSTLREHLGLTLEHELVTRS